MYCFKCNAAGGDGGDDDDERHTDRQTHTHGSNHLLAAIRTNSSIEQRDSYNRSAIVLSSIVRPPVVGRLLVNVVTLLSS